jgi:hypothetical protein
VPLFSIDWLPAVTPSFGVFSVSPEIILRRDLRQSSHDALAELDLAGADRGVAVGADANPGIEQAVVVEAAGEPLLRSGLLRASEPWSKREGERDAAEPGGEVAP